MDDAGFMMADLDNVITLYAGDRYRIVSSETHGGDSWYDVSDAYNLIPTADCRITTPVFTNEMETDEYPANVWNPGGIKGYTGVTFYYELSAPQYSTPPVIELQGQQEVRTNYGERYVEPGFSASDCFGQDITGYVRVTDNIEIFLAGVYTVTYEVTDAGGNSAKVTRTVFVTEQEIVRPPKGSPNISIIGSSPIILNIGGTPYKEQGARANDSDGNNISDRVEVIGAPDTTRAGTYTVTYRVVDEDGMEATTTREVRILAPTEMRVGGVRYRFEGQGKQKAKITHTGISTPAAGFMDLKITDIAKDMKIEIQIISTATGRTIATDIFAAKGSKQYWLDQGNYSLAVTILDGNGNVKYSLELVMPEEVILIADDEVPLANFGDLFEDVLGSAWYRDAVEFIAVHGFVIGIDGSRFEPDAPLTLGLFITTIMRAYGIEPDPEMFEDVDDVSPYTVYLIAAQLLGILDEEDVLHADRYITREEMFTLLHSFLVVIGEMPSGIDDGRTLSDFTDSDLISAEYLEEVTALVEAGLISGIGDQLLAPNKLATRAEMASITHRLLPTYTAE